MGKIMMLDEGMNIVKEGVEKAKMILDGYPASALFTPAEYMKYYEYPSLLKNYFCLYVLFMFLAFCFSLYSLQC